MAFAGLNELYHRLHSRIFAQQALVASLIAGLRQRDPQIYQPLLLLSLNLGVIEQT